VFEGTLRLLRAHGAEAASFEKASQDIQNTFAQKLQAVFTGIYSPASGREMAQVLAQERPDVVHIHNLFPLFSPSVLVACRKAGVPVVMTCHNFRLICPIGVHFQNGAVCERCAGGREYWCMMKNCRGNRLESVAYAMRGAMTRLFGLFKNNVTCFIAISDFLKQRLMAEGYPEDRIEVVYNTVAIPETASDAARGEYIAFTGRLSEEKGVDTLLAAAARLPDVPVRVGGVGPMYDVLKAAAPVNVEFVGMLDKAGLADFYRRARCIIVPSVWFEAFGLVAAEAMANGIPVVASRMGALPELVQEGKTGFLYESGNPVDLADKLQRLWKDSAMADRMGRDAREHARREFHEDVHFKRLMQVYEKAIALSKQGR